MKKKVIFPSHESLMRPLLKDKRLKAKIESGVVRLKVIAQIIEMREKLGFTQTALAKKIGVSQPFIAKIENDEASNLSLETLLKIADALNSEIEIKIRSRKAA